MRRLHKKTKLPACSVGYLTICGFASQEYPMKLNIGFNCYNRIASLNRFIPTFI